MDLKRKESKTRSNGDADEVNVEVDLLTGAMRVNPRKLLRSKATRDLLTEVECVEKRIMQGRPD